MGKIFGMTGYIVFGSWIILTLLNPCQFLPVAVVAGILTLVLNHSKSALWKYGLNRFYVLGLFALLPILSLGYFNFFDDVSATIFLINSATPQWHFFQPRFYIDFWTIVYAPGIAVLIYLSNHEIVDYQKKELEIDDSIVFIKPLRNIKKVKKKNILPNLILIFD